jgi:glycosyltransferase involved in cell wall biosynthesis
MAMSVPEQSLTQGPRSSQVPTVSVALCVYNGERYLEQQVESLFHQSRRPDEIVAVDDASSDRSFAILQALARRSAIPMRVHRNDANLGYRRNFERAMSLTRGDIIFLCDQDDFWERDKTERCLQPFLDDSSVMLVHTDAALVDADLRSLDAGLFDALELTAAERTMEDRGLGYEVLLKRNIVTGATTAVRRDVFERAAPFPDEWVHDEWLALAASLMGRLVRLDHALVHYRQHGKNQIGARQRGVPQKLKVLFGNDGKYQQRLLRRLQRLQQRAGALMDRPQPARLQLLERTLRHAAVRAALPAEHWRRLPGVLREILNGGYFRYSRGWISIVRDFFGPIDARVALGNRESWASSR